MDETPPLPLPDHSGQPSVPNGRWCPYCGADLSGVPERQGPPDDALFAAAGRRLKTALAVGFVLVWLGLSVWDWTTDPETVLLPGWFSALGALMLFYLLGYSPVGLFRGGRGR